MRDFAIRWFGHGPEASYAALAPCFQQRVNRYTHPQARQQSIEAYTLLQTLLTRHAIPLQPLRLLPSGKWTMGPWFVSLTHCATGAAALISTRNDSIDMEPVRPLSWKRVEQTLSAAERHALANSSRPEAAFMTFWTRKEAYIKQKSEAGDVSYRAIDTLAWAGRATSWESHGTIVTVLEEIETCDA